MAVVQIEAAPHWLSQGLHRQPRHPLSSLEGLLATLLRSPACATAPRLARLAQWSAVVMLYIHAHPHARCCHLISTLRCIIAACTRSIAKESPGSANNMSCCVTLVPSWMQKVSQIPSASLAPRQQPQRSSQQLRNSGSNSCTFYLLHYLRCLTIQALCAFVVVRGWVACRSLSMIALHDEQHHREWMLGDADLLLEEDMCSWLWLCLLQPVDTDRHACDRPLLPAATLLSEHCLIIAKPDTCHSSLWLPHTLCRTAAVVTPPACCARRTREDHDVALLGGHFALMRCCVVSDPAGGTSHKICCSFKHVCRLPPAVCMPTHDDSSTVDTGSNDKLVAFATFMSASFSARAHLC